MAFLFLPPLLLLFFFVQIPPPALSAKAASINAPRLLYWRIYSDNVGSGRFEETIFESLSTSKYVFLFAANMSGDVQMLLHPDDETGYCGIGKGHSYNHTTVLNHYKLNITCLYDHYFTTPYRYITVQTVVCEYPPVHLLETLTGKPVTILVNGIEANSKATFRGLPCSDLPRSAFPGTDAVSPRVSLLPAPRPPLANGMDHAMTASSSSSLKPPKFKVCACVGMFYRTDFLRFWLQHHFSLGLEYVLIYDNNSGIDQLEEMIDFLSAIYNIKRIPWNYDGTQYGMYSHCMAMLDNVCEWVMAIDVDEYVNIGKGFTTLQSVLAKFEDLAGVEALPFSFFPSGHMDVIPDGGFIKNYQCRVRAANYGSTKTFARPSLLHEAKFNVVHYFCYKPKFNPNAKFPAEVLFLNHYQYPAWPIFHRKFVKRLASALVFVSTSNDDAERKAAYENEYGAKCEYEDWKLRDEYECRFTVKANPMCGKAANVEGKKSEPTLDSIDTLVTGVGDGSMQLLRRLLSFLHAHSGSDDEYSAGLFHAPKPKMVEGLEEDHTPDSIILSTPRGVVDINWKLGKLPDGPGPNLLPSFDRVIHLVEHPLRAIRHIIKSYTYADWKHVAEATPIVKPEYSVLKRALYHWVSWNQWIETYSTDRLSVTLTNFANVCLSIGYSETACSKLPKRVRFKCDLGAGMLSWDDLDVVDSFVSGLAKNMTLQYGFELQNCP